MTGRTGHHASVECLRRLGTLLTLSQQRDVSDAPHAFHFHRSKYGQRLIQLGGLRSTDQRVRLPSHVEGSTDSLQLGCVSDKPSGFTDIVAGSIHSICICEYCRNDPKHLLT